MPTNVENFLQVAGKGIEGEISNTSYKIGSLNWLAVNTSEISELSGTRTVGLMRDDKLVAYWRLADRIRPESALAISELQSMNFEVIMLTGDSEQNAKSVAEKVGIKDVRANLSPLEKVAIIERAKNDNQLVAFAGDGLNDVAALSSANLAIAVSGGSYVALAASDITIISGGLEQVVKAIKLARKTLNTIKGNLFWAFAYNSAMIPIAMAGYLQPIWAGAAMALSSTFVVANSLVLRYRKI
jgi:P-type Cu+ transporter